jgi:hypothetical protein
MIRPFGQSQVAKGKEIQNAGGIGVENKKARRITGGPWKEVP